MTRRVVFRPEAEDEVLETRRWYEERREGLAARLPRLLNYLLRAVHDLLGYSDEFTIFLGLAFVPFLRRHPLDFLHPAPCRTTAIVEPLDTLLNRFAQAQNQASNHADDIP